MLAEARAAVAVAVTLALAACAVGPDYRAPQTKVPAQFTGRSAADAVATAAPERATGAGSPTSASPGAGARGYTTAAPVPAFWREFGDPLLADVVGRALRANHDLRIADARIAEVRALRREQRYDLAPTITASANYTKVRLDTDAAASGPRTFENYRAGFDASWEPDLFGRTRRESEARSADVGAAIAERRAVAVAVAAEVARTYFEYRGLQLRREVAERNLSNQQETARVTQARLDAGRGTQLDASRAEAQLATTRAALPALETALVAARYRLAVLAGLQPGELDALLGASAPLPALPEVVAVGTPDAWLRRRPDVARAERELAGATARIGVAVADLFPRLEFTGGIGVGAVSFGGLDDGGHDAWSLVPSLRWAAFDLGRVRAQIAASEARTDAALAAYERTVLVALEETEGALEAYRDALVRREALEQAAHASATAARLARLRNDEGAADFLDVLDAERTLLDSEDRLAAAETEARTRLIAVYKALGAGWDVAEPAPVRRAR